MVYKRITQGILNSTMSKMFLGPIMEVGVLRVLSLYFFFGYILLYTFYTSS